MDGGIERITDADEAAAVRAQALRVVVKSVAATAMTAIVLLLLP